MFPLPRAASGSWPAQTALVLASWDPGHYLSVNYLKLSFAELPLLSFLLFILPCINRDNTSDAFPPLLLRPRGTVVGLWMCARERESKLFSFISFPFHIIAPHAAS